MLIQNCNIPFEVGNTPFILLPQLSQSCGSKVKIYVKLEYFNPTGTIKDRLACGIIKHAQEHNLISKGGTFIDASTGNFGVSLAFFALKMGYQAFIIMPADVDVKYVNKIRALGSEVGFVDAEQGIEGAVIAAQLLSQEKPDSFYCNQYKNPLNIEVHKLTTGHEIITNLPDVNAFASIVGSGGTLIGVAQALKTHNKKIKVFHITNSDKGIFSNKLKRKVSSVSKLIDNSMIDSELNVPLERAHAIQRMLAKLDGVLVSTESAFNIAGALKAAKQIKKGKIVTIIPNHY